MLLITFTHRINLFNQLLNVVGSTTLELPYHIYFNNDPYSLTSYPFVPNGLLSLISSIYLRCGK